MFERKVLDESVCSVFTEMAEVKDSDDIETKKADICFVFWPVFSSFLEASATKKNEQIQQTEKLGRKTTSLAFFVLDFQLNAG